MQNEKGRWGGGGHGASKVCYWRCATELSRRYTRYRQYRIFSYGR